MPIVFAAIAPHSPLLVPNIGKENTAQFSATLNAAEKVAAALANSAAETIIVLSSKGPAFEKSFGINISPRFKANLELFGDLVTKWEYSGGGDLCGRLREELETDFPLLLVTDAGLDYASSIALSLCGSTPQQKIIPITIGSSVSAEEALRFGKSLGQTLANEKGKIALIAAADLSHRATKKSPLGYSSKGKKFDQKVVEALKESSHSDLLEASSAAEVAACEDTEVLAALLGVLYDTGVEPNALSYEAPFGVGHLVLHYDLAQTT